MTGKRTSCISHCATCGCHFHGDGAFDMHRTGTPAHRRWINPSTDPRFVSATESGYCLNSGEHDGDEPLTLEPVVVWTGA